MKKYLLVSTLLLSFAPVSSFAFPLSFKYVMCTVDEPALRDEVEELKAKWERVQRQYSPSSQYRKHISMHMKEAVGAFDSAISQQDCTSERQTLLRQLQEDLISQL